LLLAPTGDEDVGSFGHETLRGSKTNPACPTSDKCDLSFQLAAHFLVGRHSLPLSTTSSPPIRSIFRITGLPTPRRTLPDATNCATSKSLSGCSLGLPMLPKPSADAF